MKKILIFTLLMIVSSLSFATPAQQLQNILNSISTMQANFTQRIYNSRGKLTQSVSGSMVLKKPGLFRWTINGRRPLIMVSNGSQLWVYDKSLAQVTITPIKKVQANSPAIVLSNRIRLLSNYFIVFEKNGMYILNSRYKNDMLKQVQLKFSGQRLLQMTMFDNLGQHSALSFSQVRLNQQISSSQFNFSVPKGVDVVR